MGSDAQDTPPTYDELLGQVANLSRELLAYQVGERNDLAVAHARIRQLEEQLAAQAESHAREVYDLEEKLIEANHQRGVDPLTGAANRYRLEQIITYLENAVDADGLSKSGAVIVIDIDHFKEINDTHGHNAGDDVLVAIVERLREINFVDTGSVIDVIRLGGDEFAIVIEDQRGDEDRRLVGSIPPNIKDSRQNDRRWKSLEESLPTQLREKLDLAMSNKIMVRTRGGGHTEVPVEISEGIGFFEHPSQIRKALREADEEAYIRKSGLDSFLAWRNRMDKLNPQDREFVDHLLGFRFNVDLRGGCEIDRDISSSVRLTDNNADYERFFKLTEVGLPREAQLNPLDKRGLSWVFGDQRELRNQSGQDLHLLA